MTELKAKFIKTRNNGVSVKLNIGTDHFRYTIGTRRRIRLNEDADKEMYPFIVAYSVFHDFLHVNNIDGTTLAIDPESIDTFYGYDYYGASDYFVNPTKGKVDKWWNVDCPPLYRYTPNKDESTNMLGMTLACFQTLICEAGWRENYIGDTVTEKEVMAFTKGYEHTTIYADMQKALEARALNEKDIESLKKDIESYEKNIQTIIDNNKEIALSAVQPYTDQSFGLDCGWVNIYTTNETYNNKKKLLKNSKGNHTMENLDVKLPLVCQSTTLQRMQFEALQPILEEQLGDKIYANTMLD